MGKTELNKIYTFEISIKIRFFWYIYWYQIPFFRVSVTIEPGCSLLTVHYHELFDNILNRKCYFINIKPMQRKVQFKWKKRGLNLTYFKKFILLWKANIPLLQTCFRKIKLQYEKRLIELSSVQAVIFVRTKNLEQSWLLGQYPL
jgi:hypothetical protein